MGQRERLQRSMRTRTGSLESRWSLVYGRDPGHSLLPAAHAAHAGKNVLHAETTWHHVKHVKCQNSLCPAGLCVVAEGAPLFTSGEWHYSQCACDRLAIRFATLNLDE